MSKIADEIRANITVTSSGYGAWGILRPDQRKQIGKLCDTCDMFEQTADYLMRERSEGAREIFAEIEDLFFDKYLLGNITASLFEDEYAKLKKKYTEETNGNNERTD